MVRIPAWLLLTGTRHAITKKETDVAVVTAVYNKYKKCKKDKAFRASIDALSNLILRRAYPRQDHQFSKVYEISGLSIDHMPN
jgi:hypothetical protein